MIAIFGGTFDPIHEGHMQVIRSVLEQLSPQKLYLVPTGKNPHKATSPQTNPEHRLGMVKLAVAEISDSRVEILDWEIKSPDPSYTIDTIRKIRKQTTEPLTLVLGNEVYQSLSRWKEPDELLKEVKCVVIPRLNEISAGSVRTLNVPKVSVSGTELRKTLTNTSQRPKGLTQSVWEYIKKNHLYAVK